MERGVYLASDSPGVADCSYNAFMSYIHLQLYGTDGARVSRMCAYYHPNPQHRQIVLEPTTSAICFIDTQNYNCSKDGAIYGSLNNAERQVCLLDVGAIIITILRLSHRRHRLSLLCPDFSE